MALHAAGGLVVSGRNVSYKGFDGGATVTLLDSDPDHGNVGYNDLTTDAKGRIYVGSLGSSPVFADGRAPQAGNLYLIDLDGSSRIVGRDVQLTNGLGFSPDGRTLYHSDSRRSSVFCYAVAADGTLGEKRLFVRRRQRRAGRTRRIGRRSRVGGAGRRWSWRCGIQRRRQQPADFVEIPQPMCTSVCFGGDDLKDLYIVSGSEGTGSDRGGAIYRHRCDVAGLPVAPARTAIPS